MKQELGLNRYGVINDISNIINLGGICGGFGGHLEIY
jgi:hypothetical protein